MWKRSSQIRPGESLREHYDLAQLSKTLATINTESPVDFSYEKARLGDLYTKEAFALCKRLDFKNLLARFDQTMSQELTEVKEFFTCEDLSGCEALFEKAGKQKAVGTALLSDKEEVYGLGLAITEQEIYYIPVANLITGPIYAERSQILR